MIFLNKSEHTLCDLSTHEIRSRAFIVPFLLTKVCKIITLASSILRMPLFIDIDN
jgi:hypothetical protein